MGTGRLREAPYQVRGVSEPGVPPGDGSGHPRSPPGAARRWRYPLLTDETCWLVTADFDKASWADDVLAFVGDLPGRGIPAAVERSRSGQWRARVVLLLSAGRRECRQEDGRAICSPRPCPDRHQLSMESYDRLFPNQDTLPAAGSATSSRSRSSMAPAGGQHRLRRRPPRASPGPVGVLDIGPADRSDHGRRIVREATRNRAGRRRAVERDDRR